MNNPVLDLLFEGGPILIDGAFANGCALGVSNGRIAWIGAATDAPQARERIALEGQMLLPGFIDVQVNGGGGVMFNDSQDVATLEQIAQAHRAFGTTGFLPTLISDELDVADAGIRAVGEAMFKGVPGVLGIHLEGPYLAPSRRGIHPAHKLRVPDANGIRRMTALEVGKTLITLAPEVTGSAAIADLVGRGALVCLGHTAASAEQVEAALAAGARGFTHLFNAMPPLANRAPGPVAVALLDRTAWCGLIVDGFHVDPKVLRVALACRPLDRFMLVTDAMAHAGESDGHFVFDGRTIDIVDGCPRDDDGTIAGSTLTMAGAVRNAVRWLGLSLAEAVTMASAAPAAFLGLDDDIGRLAVGLRANLLIANDDLVIAGSWIDGKA